MSVILRSCKQVSLLFLHSGFTVSMERSLLFPVRYQKTHLCFTALLIIITLCLSYNPLLLFFIFSRELLKIIVCFNFNKKKIYITFGKFRATFSRDNQVIII